MRIWSHLLKNSLMENFTFCAAWSHFSLKRNQAINKSKSQSLKLSFSLLSYDYVKSLIQNLESSEANSKNNVPTGITINNNSIFANIFDEHINRCIVNSQFPDNLNVGEVVSIFKKDPKKIPKT